MNKIFLNSLIVLSLQLPLFAMADGISSLRDFYSNTDSMRAQFHQVVTDVQGRKEQEVGGVMQLQRPNKFRWDYKKPYEQQIISDGKKVYLYDVDLAQVSVRDLSKALGSSPAAMLAGGDLVEKSFILKNATRRADQADTLSWVLALPKNKDSGFERVLLGFEYSNLKKMEIYDSFNHITAISFSEVIRNPKLKDTTFLFMPPAGVDVVSE
ncbi:MAG: outer membrane lipoprotein chaperone LolA [Methylophilaceae bacterium]|nr:outer membrane lipoprotein chaperone LolA [Methylophilaceae bacterium]